MLTAGLLLSGCSGDLSTLAPAGPAASSIARLWWVMATGGTVLFVLVLGLFVLTLYRPGFGSVLSPRAWLLLGGLALPIPVLTLLLVYTFIQGERLVIGGVAAAAPIRIEARARMWEWEFRYPDHHGTPSTRNVMHIPAGRPVEIVATSEDIIHGFWVPRLAGKIDAIPGHATRLRLLADEPGKFGGACAEYCGLGHTRMLFTVRAHEPAAFSQILDDAPSAGTGGSP